MSDISGAVKDPRIMSVSEAVARIDLNVKSMKTLLVEGEISSFTNNRASGHWYFAIKDEEAVLNCMMFASKNYAVTFSPAIGDKVKVGGNLSVYSKTGRLSLEVRRMVRSGQGELFEKFLALKKRLELEGLFRSEIKRKIPLAPKTIGVVTGLQTAALKDVIIRLKKYSPYANIIVYPTLVQGEAAAEGIVKSLQTASERAEVDVVLLVRGGGSIEDLWCFNDETVARAIRQCSIPVVTGIGHDSDQTIADFAADLWAPNPTAAAAAAAAPKNELLLKVEKLIKGLHKDIETLLSNSENSVAYVSRLFESPDVFLTYFSDRFKTDLLSFKGSAGTFIFEARNDFHRLILALGQISPLPEASKFHSFLLRISNAVNQGLANRERQLRVELPPMEFILAGHANKLNFLVNGLIESSKSSEDWRQKRLTYELLGLKNKLSVADKQNKLDNLLKTVKVQKDTFFVQLRTPQTFKLENLEGKLRDSRKEVLLKKHILASAYAREVFFQKMRLLNELKNLRKFSPVIQREPVRRAAESIKSQGQMRLSMRVNFLHSIESKLTAFDPKRMLKIGYAIVKRENKVVGRGKGLKEGEAIQIIFYDEAINARVERDANA